MRWYWWVIAIAFAACLPLSFLAHTSIWIYLDDHRPRVSGAIYKFAIQGHRDIFYVNLIDYIEYCSTLTAMIVAFTVAGLLGIMAKLKR